MVFFKNNENNPDAWKEKYFRLVDRHELIDNEYKANEDILCKTIIRFALAVKGYNKTLDPHFERIRTVLKNGVKQQQLQKELEAFSSALISLEETPSSHKDAFLLFEFLYRQYPQHKDKLETIQNQYESTSSKNPQVLFIDLLELVAEKSSGNVYFAVELPNQEQKQIRSHFLHLLDYAEIPQVFNERLEQIKFRLQTEINSSALPAILDDTVKLFCAVNKHLSLEQRELAEFLSNVTEQLSEFASTATGVGQATEVAGQKRSLFDDSVVRQMQDLQNKSANATQIESLKQLIHNHLGSINLQIQTHRKQEQIERENLQVELRTLTQKVRELESHSSELKTKLDVAQQNATRDPLTQLPNRLALENRLIDEIARWHRLSKPLSLLIWDIDFFKKINDNFGHSSGDKALIAIARLLAEHCRQTDFVARFGGEEFVMLLPDTDANKALQVADKLRATVEKTSFIASGNKISITLSCGISQLTAADNNDTLFERADKALYQAKMNGRNQCVVI